MSPFYARCATHQQPPSRCQSLPVCSTSGPSATSTRRYATQSHPTAYTFLQLSSRGTSRHCARPSWARHREATDAQIRHVRGSCPRKASARISSEEVLKFCLFYKVCYAARETALPAYNTTESLAVYVQGTRHRQPTGSSSVFLNEFAISLLCVILCIFVFLCDILLPSGVINDDDDDDYKANRRLRCAVDCARRH